MSAALPGTRTQWFTQRIANSEMPARTLNVATPAYGADLPGEMGAAAMCPRRCRSNSTRGEDLATGKEVLTAYAQRLTHAGS